MIKFYSSNIQFEKDRHFASVYLPVIIDEELKEVENILEKYN